MEWRKLYNFKKIGLGQSAAILGLSKKSLDDYLLQIRCGAKLGFDFEFHKYSKVGVLRSFVKKQRKLNGITKTQDIKKLEFRCNGLHKTLISLLKT